MMIKFWERSCLDEWRDSKELRLSVAFHSPSSSAINVWKETSFHAKHMQLAAQFRPAPTINEDGVRRHKKWQNWED